MRVLALRSFTFYEDDVLKRDLVDGNEYDVHASDGAHFISLGYAMSADDDSVDEPANQEQGDDNAPANPQEQ